MKSLYNITLIFLLLSGNGAFAQTNRQYETNPERKRAFNWLFGNKIWLDYNTNPPQVKSGSEMNTLEPASAYSDTSGNLLLYSNGLTVWNKNHKVIINGTGLNGDNSSWQGALFIRHPAIDSIVYLFTTDDQCGPNGLQVSTISIYPDIDSSRIIDKNRVLVTPVCESISSIQHQNGRFTWVTVHSKTGNTFYSFLISDDGISSCPVTSNQGLNYDGHFFNCQTASRFSSNGKHFAITMFDDDKVMLLKFDNYFGQFTFFQKFDNVIIPTGVAFSNNDSLLYIIERNRQINQIFISTGQNNIVKSINNQFAIVQIEKSPYRTILVNVDDSSHLASILYPDSIGIKAKYIHKYLSLNGVNGRNRLCNFNQSYFHTPSIDLAYKYSCLDNTISFEGRDTFYADSFNWEFKKVYGSTSVSSFIKKPTIAFFDTGIYEVTFIATKGNRNDTVIKRITIYPKIDKNFLGRDTLYKSDKPFSLELKTPANMHCILWQDSSSSPTFTADTTGVYFVKITNKAFCTISDTLVVTRCDNSLPKPDIFRKNDTLITSSLQADSLIWFKGNKLLTITRDTFILLTDTGTYRVEVAKDGYCNSSSGNLSYQCLIGLASPGIRLGGDTLYAYHPQADSFVWYRNNQFYRSGKDTFIVLSDTGIFRVEAFKQKYCNSISESISNKCLDNLIRPSIYLSRDTLYAYQLQADSFVWYRNGQKIKSTKEAFIKLTDTGTYRVEAIKKAHCNRSSSVLLVSELITGLYKILQTNIRIYPNPADETLTIETQEGERFIIRLYDPEGRLMLEKKSEDTGMTLSVREFTQGLYLLELNNYQTFYHYKILIQ